MGCHRVFAFLSVGADMKANASGLTAVRARDGLLERCQRRVTLDALRESGSSFWTKCVGRNVKHPERSQESAYHAHHGRRIATEFSGEIELVAFHTSCAQEPVPKLGLYPAWPRSPGMGPTSKAEIREAADASQCKLRVRQSTPGTRGATTASAAAPPLAG